MVEERRDEAQAFRAAARQGLRSRPSDRAEAESLARRALERYARSLDWAEDTEMEDDTHRTLDRAGTWVRLTFGCHLVRDGTNYRQECPVALAHNRIGVSIGGVAKRKCSLCGADVSECEHVPGVAYLVPGGSGDLGWCRICLAEDCGHTPEEIERVSMISIVHEVDLEEVSIVPKPANPEARLLAMSVTTAELTNALGEGFAPGVDVDCDRCLRLCHGLVRGSLGFEDSATPG